MHTFLTLTFSDFISLKPENWKTGFKTDLKKQQEGN